MDPCRYNIVHGDKQKVPGISPTAHVKNCVNGFLYHAVHLSAFCYFVKGGPGSTARFSSVPCLTGFSAALPWALRARQFIVRITPKKLHPAAAQGNPCQGDNMHRIQENGGIQPPALSITSPYGLPGIKEASFPAGSGGFCHRYDASGHETRAAGVTVTCVHLIAYNISFYAVLDSERGS